MCSPEGRRRHLRVPALPLEPRGPGRRLLSAHLLHILPLVLNSEKSVIIIISQLEVSALGISKPIRALNDLLSEVLEALDDDAGVVAVPHVDAG